MTLIPDSATRITFDKKPMVKCRVNGVNCELLMDSGANVNVNEDIFKAFQCLNKL